MRVHLLLPQKAQTKESSGKHHPEMLLNIWLHTSQQKPLLDIWHSLHDTWGAAFYWLRGRRLQNCLQCPLIQDPTLPSLAHNSPHRAAGGARLPSAVGQGCLRQDGALRSRWRVHRCLRVFPPFKTPTKNAKKRSALQSGALNCILGAATDLEKQSRASSHFLL